MKRVLKAMFFLVIVGCLGYGGYALFGRGNGDENGFKLIEVTRGAITEKAVAVGQVEPRLQFHVKSKIPGIVKRCLADVGDRVAQGDALIEIAPDPTPFELTDVNRNLEAAEADFHKAQADHRRIQQLVTQGVLAQADLDASQAGYDQAKVALERARDNWALTRDGRIARDDVTMESIIRAPSGGTVLSRSVDPGDPVVPLTSYQAGTELAVIANMDDLIFKGTVDEIDVGKLAVGLEARLKIGALPDAVVTGRLTKIAPKAREEDNARLFDVEIELNPCPDVLLRAGYSANADVVVRERTDTVLIPERLLIFEGDGEETFVEVPAPDPETPPIKVAVTIGLSDGLSVEILDGLDPGDRVIQRPPKEI